MNKSLNTIEINHKYFSYKVMTKDPLNHWRTYLTKAVYTVLVYSTLKEVSRYEEDISPFTGIEITYPCWKDTSSYWMDFRQDEPSSFIGSPLYDFHKDIRTNFYNYMMNKELILDIDEITGRVQPVSNNLDFHGAYLGDIKFKCMFDWRETFFIELLTEYINYFSNKVLDYTGNESFLKNIDLENENEVVKAFVQNQLKSMLKITRKRIYKNEYN